VPESFRRRWQGVAQRIARRRWDLTALLNAADPRAALPERHLWWIRLTEWLRHPEPVRGDDAPSEPHSPPTPIALRRLRHLLNVLERHPEYRERVVGLLRAFRREVDVAALLADFGFAERVAMFGEALDRLRRRVLPATPATTDLAHLFGLLFPDEEDATWIDAIGDADLARLARLFEDARPDDEPPLGWRAPFHDALLILAAQVAAAGSSAAMRQRMSAELLAGRPFRQLLRTAESLLDHAEAGDRAALLRDAQMLHALLDACRHATASIRGHLEDHGVSIDLLFQMEQLHERTLRIEALLACLLAPAALSPAGVPAGVLATVPAPSEAVGPGREIAHLVATLVRVASEQRSLRALFARQYSMLARKLAERHAETGQHYITRTRAEWWAMLKRALGGGAVIAGTTFAKFAIAAIGLSAFWGGFWAGINYAASFVAIHLLHWTVATKQPAMTAPAMAAKLDGVADEAALESFVDEVANLIRSQTAGILGNLAMVVPVVLAVQATSAALFGRPVVGEATAEHVLHDLTLLGPTPLYAAFTGVLLFAASLVAGWAENWFVLHRLDSALRWNPRIVSLLGASRAARWSGWWRANVSGIAANVSLGLLLGIVPVLLQFFGLGIQVRHVTLSTGQIAAAVGAFGWPLLGRPELWGPILWCLAAVPLTAALNLGVSFFLAFKLAMRSRGIRVADRSRIYSALRRRLRTRFASFLVPPRTATKVQP